VRAFARVYVGRSVLLAFKAHIAFFLGWNSVTLWSRPRVELRADLDIVGGLVVFGPIRKYLFRFNAVMLVSDLQDDAGQAGCLIVKRLEK
jgi:hypothetical protein